MRARWMTVGASVVALALGACSDGGGPGGPIVGSLVLDFCAGEEPIFFAYQNDGGDWTRVDAASDNSFTFDVTERVGIAITHDFGNEVLTDVYYATRTELEPLSGRACTEASGSKNLNGSVADVLVGERAVIAMGDAEAKVEPPPSTFTVSGVPDGPQDLVAHREVNAEPDRVIVRRAQNFVNGSTMPVLDFASSEAADVLAHTLTVAGLVAGETNLLDQYFTTASGTLDTLYLAPLFSASPQTIFGVPSALTQAGDLHRLDLTAEGGGGDRYRAVRHWYRNAGNKSVTLGGSLAVPSTPVFVGASPYLRLRTTVQSQLDYPDFVTAYFIQGNLDRRSVFVTVTRGYHNGTPATWQMEIPNFSSAGGYPTFAGLVSGQGTQWFVEAFNGELSDFIGATPSEGASVHWAGYTSATTVIRAEADTPGRSHRPTAMNQRAFRR